MDEREPSVHSEHPGLQRRRSEVLRGALMVNSIRITHPMLGVDAVALLPTQAGSVGDQWIAGCMNS